MAEYRQDRAGHGTGGGYRDNYDDASEPVAPGFDSVATLLRETREHYGEDLRSVAQALKIRYVHLQAIEDGRYDDLPGPTYALGFIRTYAEYLGLDSDKVVRRFKAEVEGLDHGTQLVFPTPAPEGRVPGGAIILISVLLVALAYGTWLYLSNQGKEFVDLIPDVPERLQALLQDEEEAEADARESGTAEPEGASIEPEPVSVEPDSEQAANGTDSGEATDSAVASPALEASLAAITKPTDSAEPEDAAGGAGESAMSDEEAETLNESPSEAAAEPPDAPVTAASEDTSASSTPLADGGSTGEPTSEAEPEAAAAAAPTTAVAVESPPAAPAIDNGIPAAPSSTQLARNTTGKVYGSENADARIVLRATLDSWVQIRDSDEALLLTRVLRAGDTYQVPNRQGLTLLTGNAGGLEIVVDGTALAPMGPVGAVRRDIALDPQLLIQGRALRQ